MLQNKKILVAGAGGLLGSYTVKALLDSGATVLATDLNYDGMNASLRNQDINISGSQLLMMQLDVVNEQEVIDFFSKIEKLDGAVNCTYPRTASYGKSFFDVTLSSFNENVALHLGSAFLFTQQCAVYFFKNKTPFSLVNIASIYGVIAPKFALYSETNMTMPVEYAAIKSALIHLNKYVVSYIANSDFRINCVSPGGFFDHQPDSFLRAYKEETFGKGMLDMVDVTGAILYLLSDNSRYMNGQNLVVDDGFSL